MGRKLSDERDLVDANECLVIAEAKLSAFFDSLTDEQKAVLAEFRFLDKKCQNAEKRISMITKRLAK